jgi:hypothetical protein
LLGFRLGQFVLDLLNLVFFLFELLLCVPQRVLAEATGSAPYGYKAIKVDGHKDREIVEEEAVAVRKLYEMFAIGETMPNFTAFFTASNFPTPRPHGRMVRLPKGTRLPNGTVLPEDTRMSVARMQKAGLEVPKTESAWAQETSRQMLKQPFYCGWLEYGRRSVAYGRELSKKDILRGRERGPINNDKPIRVAVPDLRIVDLDIIARVDARLLERKERWAEAVKEGMRRPMRAHGRHLLSGGFLKCGHCGGHYQVRGQRYQCGIRRHRPGACENMFTLPVVWAEEVILETIAGEFLGTKYIEQLLDVSQAAPVDESEYLLANRERLLGESKNMNEAIFKGIVGPTEGL